MGRMSEINRLTWDDVNLEGRYLVLYTRKKKGGHLTPRRIPMTQRLFEILCRRYAHRDPGKPWVFWHRYWSGRTRESQQGPYRDRSKVMKTLCRQGGIRYFRFHAFKHVGASLMENHNVSIGTIQRILGHESRITTEIYLHSLGESERAAIQISDQLNEKVSHNKEKEPAPVGVTD